MAAAAAEGEAEMSADGGYAVARDYVRGHRRNAAPAWLRAVQVLRGRRPAEATGAFTLLDLGCGSGFQLLATAAANPRARCVGVDLSPDHILAARELAAAAGLRNAEFVEAGFDEIAAAPERVGTADFVIAHGVWTWISDAARGDFLAILRAAMRPGALLYLGYNAMPNWAMGEPLRKLVRVLAEGRRGPGQEEAIREAIGFLKFLRDETSGVMAGETALSALLDGLEDQPMDYLAHELLPAAGGAAWHDDVARAMAGARLSYVGAGRLIDNFDQLGMRDSVRETVTRAERAGYGELFRDLAIGRSFRMDVFARGQSRVGQSEAGMALEALPVALSPEERPEGPLLRAPWGELKLDEEAQAAAEAAVAEGPCTVGEAADRAARAGLDRRRAGQALTVMLAAERLIPLATLTPEPDAVEACGRFNAAVLSANWAWPALASPFTGGGVEASGAARKAMRGEVPAGDAAAAAEIRALEALLPAGALPREA